MKVLCVGHITYDISLLLNYFPDENSKNSVDKIVQCGGGQTANSAYLLGKWGIETYIMGVVGNDLYANKIIDEFNNVGVDTTYLQIGNEETSSSYIIVNSKNASRTILSHNSKKCCSDINLDFYPDIILTDCYEYELSLNIIKKYPNAVVVVDAGRLNDNVLELSKLANYVVCSKDFAETLTGINIDYSNESTLNCLYQKMKQLYSKHLVITLEDKGCMYEYDNKINLMSTIKVNSIDTTGAGDMFHGAFVYGLARNMNYLDVLKISNITGALATTNIGGRTSTPDINDVMRIYNENK